MTEPVLRPRPDLLDVAPYVSPQRPARYAMNTNESPYPPPGGLVDAVLEELGATAFNRYPDNDARDLHEAIAGRNAWMQDGVWVANGSNEVLMHLFLAFGGPGRSALTFEPTYSLHTSVPRITGTRVLSVPRADDLLIDLDDAVETVVREQPDVVVVCSPNNPSGACEPIGTVRALLAEAPGVVLVDEAYIEFAEPSDSVRPLLEAHPNLVLVKTFSKAWRLAGVRIGYMLADPGLVAELKRVRLPYHLSAITQAMGRAAVRFADETLATVEEIARERDRIAMELAAMGVKTYHSRANFILFEVDDGDALWSELLERGVLVRNFSAQPGLSGCLRVTAGLREENDAFIDAMRDALDA
ncbi:histidinol-phosphate transaminase [soil metagenome]